MPQKLSKKKQIAVAQRRLTKKSGMMGKKCPECKKPMNKCTCDM